MYEFHKLDKGIFQSAECSHIPAKDSPTRPNKNKKFSTEKHINNDTSERAHGKNEKFTLPDSLVCVWTINNNTRTDAKWKNRMEAFALCVVCVAKF